MYKKINGKWSTVIVAKKFNGRARVMAAAEQLSAALQLQIASVLVQS